MVTILDRKLRRDLYAAKGLLLAIICILGLGVSAYVANLSLYFNLELSRRSYYAECRMADFWVDIEKLPRSEIDRLSQVEGIAELRPRIVMPVTVDLEGVPQPLSGRIVSMPIDPRPVINNLVLRRGSYFTDSRRAEVIISEGFAQSRNLHPGDRLHILLNDRRQELLVVGTAISSEFVFARAPGTMIPDKSSFVILYVNERFAEETTNLEGATNQILGKLNADRSSEPLVVTSELEQQLERFGEATTTHLANHESHQQLSSDLRGLRTINLIVPTVFLAVAALILDVLMMRLAQQQRTVIGTLKALGYTNHQVVLHFLKYGIVVGLLGGLTGAAFGYWLAGFMLDMFRQFYEFSTIINRPYLGIVAGCILLSIVMAVAGTIRGVRQVMQLRPAEAMRPRAPESSQRLFLERWTALWKQLGFRWQMVIRGLFRNRLRVFTGIFSAMMGSALILQTLQINASFGELIRFTFDRMIVSDFDLTLKDEVDLAGFFEVTRFPGVDYAEPVLTVACTFSNGNHQKKGAVTGIRSTARLTVPRDRRGTPVSIPDHGLVLTRRLAEILHVHAGAKIRIVPLNGERQNIDVTVSKVVESFVGTAAYANWNFLNQLVNEEESLNSVQAEVNLTPNRLAEFYQRLKNIPKLQGFSALGEQKEQLLILLQPLRVVNALLILFAGLLFCGSIVTSSLISLAERRQEIATFRVMGYTPRQIGGIFLRESLIVNTIGIFLGLPVGYWFAAFVNHFIATDLTRLPFVLPISLWVTTVILGLLFTLIAYIPVYRAVRTLDWLDALNTKE